MSWLLTFRFFFYAVSFCPNQFKMLIFFDLGVFGRLLGLRVKLVDGARPLTDILYVTDTTVAKTCTMLMWSSALFLTMCQESLSP